MGQIVRPRHFGGENDSSTFMLGSKQANNPCRFPSSRIAGCSPKKCSDPKHLQWSLPSLAYDEATRRGCLLSFRRNASISIGRIPCSSSMMPSKTKLMFIPGDARAAKPDLGGTSLALVVLLPLDRRTRRWTPARNMSMACIARDDMMRLVQTKVRLAAGRMST